jgi:hypothetical protein
MICTAANALWLAGCLQEAARFRRATTRVREEQARVLQRLVRTNANTEFGRRHGFASIRTAREYQERVPMRSYDEYCPYIDSIAAGSANVLTRDRITLFEPTSGSAAATKLIPYTAALQRQFQKGIQPWIADLFLHHPDLMRGPAYWSVSPVISPHRHTAGGIPIGFDDDSQYVGGWRRALVQAVLAAPASLRHAPDMNAFRYQTLLALVRNGGLRIISVWNPTFLTLLLDGLPQSADALRRDLQADRVRADVLRAALAAGTAAERHAILWPRLGLLSCWTGGRAAGPAAELGRLFPHARLQGKGLIATEGFVSLPQIGHDGSALAVRSHFLEFAPVDSRNEACETPALLAHELERGRRYAVILSTAGGLYRYCLHDVIEVIGHLHECPLIAFLGKQEYVSDWFGEKLHEAHVASVLDAALDSAGVSASFAMLACDPTSAPPAYVLYIEAAADDDTLNVVARDVEQSLHGNFHYDYARRLGQLGPVRVFRAERAADAFLSAAVRAGRRAGDVKLLALDRRDGWSREQRGHFIATRRSTPCGSALLLRAD